MELYIDGLAVTLKSYLIPVNPHPKMIIHFPCRGNKLLT